MKTVAVIAEYNPFHLGHMAQLRRIRNDFGEDTAIITVLSGNFTQRGEIAIADVFTRAKTAVVAGVNLVLKLPFPYSCSSAEFFASAGVSVLASLGVVDALSFGSECGDLTTLQRVSERTGSPEFLAMQTGGTMPANAGHAYTAELIYRTLYGNEDSTVLQSPNDLLAIEYIRALSGLEIIPHVVPRIGCGYRETVLSPGHLPSATALRRSLHTGMRDLLDYMPPEVAAIYLEEADRHKMPADQQRLSNVVLAFLRNIWQLPETDLTSDGSGLYRRICRMAMMSESLDELVGKSVTKRYTAARIRRLIWYALFGVTSSELRAKPTYTQVLAFDDTGALLLRKIKKNGGIELLTKPADVICLSPEARHMATADLRADALFSLAEPVVSSGGTPYRRTPYRKLSDGTIISR